MAKLSKLAETSALPDAPFSDDQLLCFKDWCRFNAISERAGRRIWADPKARPTLTKLTSKKFACSIGNNRRWQQSRAV